MDTRTALLDSAERAARQRGFDAFSYADLARDVGIRKASIHHHFPVKADLAFGLIERYAAQFAEALSGIDTEYKTGAEKLRAYHQTYRDALADGSQICLCVSMSAGRDSFSEPVLEQLNLFHESSTAWLANVIQQGISDGSVSGFSAPETDAPAILALMEGAQLMARASSSLTPFDKATQAFLEKLT
ncbi:MAG: TetR/AcrR family transcriptional regulator [Pseudomonadota bacterium]